VVNLIGSRVTLNPGDQAVSTDSTCTRRIWSGAHRGV